MAEATQNAYLGTGRRKTSVARVRLMEGNGQITINGRELNDYFTEDKDRAAVLGPLEITEMRNRLNVVVKVQGGGFTEDMTQKRTKPPVKNEADNGLKNKRGTLSMARTNDINSATSQFFVNLKDNDFLDHSRGNFGYAVFARVTDGMDVVDKIAAVKTGRKRGFDDVPIEAVIMKSVRRDKA